MTLSELSQTLYDRGLSVDQIIIAIRMAESRADGVDYILAMIGGLETSGRPEQLAEFIEKICPVLTLFMPDAARARRAPAPKGAKERWGYEGVVIPRLPERDWWPLRNGIVAAADWTCHYCGDRHRNMCADHVVPLSRGGSNDPENLVCCCVPCNSSKADRLLSEWRGRYV